MNILGIQNAMQSYELLKHSLEITGLNIANVNTPGYTRQSLVLEADTPSQAFQGQVNLSPSSNIVKAKEVARYRDHLLDNSYRNTSTNLAEEELFVHYLGQIETAFDENSGDSVVKQLESFWQSWNNLSEEPSDSALREEVIRRGEYLVNSLHDRWQQLRQSRLEINQAIDTKVSEFNSALEKLFNINIAVTGSFMSTPDLNVIKDEKDRLLDQLHKFINLQEAENPGGGISLFFQGEPLITAQEPRPLSLVTGEETFYSLRTQSGTEVEPTAGELKALFNLRDQVIPDYIDRLNSFAQEIIQVVNQLHRNSYNASGESGFDFFSGSDASDIQLNITEPAMVAASLARLVSTQPINAQAQTVNLSESLLSQAANFETAPDAAGSFTIDDQLFTWTQDDNLKDIIDRINQANIGVKAEFDSYLQKIHLRRDPWVGEGAGFTVADQTGNLMSALKLSSANLETSSTGDGSAALEISSLSGKKCLEAGTKSLTDHWKSFLIKLGNDTRNHKNRQEDQELAWNYLGQLRNKIYGVSLEEEMINLIRYQEAMLANSRVISVMNDTFNDFLYEMKG